MSSPLRRFAFASAIAVVAAVLGAHSVLWAVDDFVNVGLVSTTLGAKANRICVGVGYSADNTLGCPTYAPTVNSAGLLTAANVSVTGGISATGNVSANKFVGDGSLLTGLAGGDRITSSTFAIISNPTGYASLSTAGTTWGYLGSAVSYLPSLNVGGLVSATYISTSNIVQIGSTTTLACDSSITGSLRYTNISDTLQICTGSGWKSLVSGTATGVTYLTSLTDVSISAPVVSQTIMWNGSKWVASTIMSHACPTGYTYNATTGSCYKLQSAANYTTAASSCVSSGGYLAKINNATEQGQVYAFAGSVSAWIGFNDQALEGTFVWQDGSSGGYTNWWPGQPDNASGNEDCVQFWSAASGQWNDNNCASSYASVCEADTAASTLEDNLGNHLAEQALEMGGYNIQAAGTITATTISTTYDYSRYTSTTQGFIGTLTGSAATFTGLGTFGTGLINGGFTVTGDVSASRVSTTYISTSNIVQIGSTTTLACGSSITGSLRYTNISDTLQICTGSGWRSLVSGTAGSATPAGADTNVQYNSGGSALGAEAAFTYNATTNVLTADTVSGTNALNTVALSATTVYASRSVSTTYISTSNIVQIGSTTTLACGSSITGSLRYTNISDTLQICTGSGWKSLSSSTTAGTSTIAGATDVQLTNLAGRDYLRYDSGTSKWVNISESTAMSTTTMVTNFPDVIKCNMTNPNTGETTFYLTHAPSSSTGKYIYRHITSSGSYDVNFNSNGTYFSYTGVVTSNCNVSIASLYASGRAFNFIGGSSRWQDVAGFSYLTSNPVGIGVTVSSSAKLDVAGVISATGLSITGTITATTVSSTYISASNIVQIGSTTTLACGSSITGSLRYTNISDTLQICTGSGWKSLSSSTTAGTSTIAGATDVQLTNLAGRDYLRYDSGSSKWVNISESTAMSTTTMVAGWPDALYCNLTNPASGYTMFYLTHSNPSLYQYRAITSSGTYDINFNSNGTFNSYTGVVTSNCNTSISSLYASGRAFNFIGGSSRWQDVAGFSYLTSNPVGIGVTVSSSAKLDVAGVISATGLSITGTITATTVSSTYISASNIVQIGSTTSLACGSSITGSLRYTNISDTLQICTGSGWRSLVSGTAGGATPAGADTNVQYNSGGSALGAEAAFTYNATTNVLTADTVSGTNALNTVALSATTVYASRSVSTTYISTSNIVQIGSTTTLACGSSITGSLRYTNISDTLQICTGSGWTSLNSSSTPASSFVTGSYTGTGSGTKSINLGFRPKMVVVKEVNGTYAAQTITIDGITSAHLHLRSYHTANFNEAGATGNITITSTGFDAAGTANDSTFNAAGTTYYYIAFSNESNASQWVTADTDIYYPTGNVGIGTTSPGAKLDVSGVISATGLSITGTITATTVSSTYISASNIVQIGSTTSLACGSSITGSLRYTNISDTLQICTGSGWKSLVSGTVAGGDSLPSGMISVFNLTSCPSTWSTSPFTLSLSQTPSPTFLTSR